MLIGVNKLQHYQLEASDGEIGSVYDAFLDDEFWILRYLVVDTARWLPGRKVLLTPGVLGKPEWLNHQLPVKLTRSQVQNSPDIDSDQPVSRQREMELYTHYGWPFYWGMPEVLPIGVEAPLRVPIIPPPVEPPAKEHNDPHLRSVRELRSYRIQASDGEIGHVDDFVVDDETWEVRYMVVATTNWLPGRKVLISPQWLIGDISWEKHQVTVILTRESIKHSPEYKPASPPTRPYENELHEHYGRPGYWMTGREGREDRKGG
jgi:hypothetical protein